MIERVEVELNRVADRHPGVELLKTIPGVGNRTAEAVVAWVGDPGRAQSRRRLGSRSGRTGTVSASKISPLAATLGPDRLWDSAVPQPDTASAARAERAARGLARCLQGRAAGAEA